MQKWRLKVTYALSLSSQINSPNKALKACICCMYTRDVGGMSLRQRMPVQLQKLTPNLPFALHQLSFLFSHISSFGLLIYTPLRSNCYLAPSTFTHCHETHPFLCVTNKQTDKSKTLISKFITIPWTY